MTAKLDAGEAERVMLDAGFMPLVDYPGSNNPWPCRCLTCGREVSPTLYWTRKGGGCKYCAGNAVDPAEARLLMLERGLEPLVEYPGRHNPWLCRCGACGREVSPTFGSVRGGSGCRFCARRAVHPDTASQEMRAAGWDPTIEYPGRNSAPWSATCVRCGVTGAPTYAAVKRGGGVCVSCVSEVRLVTAEQVKQVMLDAGLQPIVDYPGSMRQPWLCRCVKCGTERKVRPDSVVRRGSGCKPCSMRAAAARRKHTTGVRAEAEMREHGLAPLVPYPGARKPWLCRCDRCGNEVSPQYTSIQQGGGGCGFCARVVIDPAMAADTLRGLGLEPLTEYPGRNNKPWPCRCTSCGRDVTVTWNVIGGGGKGCPFCTGVRVDADEAGQVMIDAGLQPLTAYPGATNPWSCRCVTCGQEVSPSYTNIKRGQGGCLHCAGRTPTPAEDAVRVASDLGLQPVEVYPGRTSLPWLLTCDQCGRQVRKTLISLREGHGCDYCDGNRIPHDVAVATMTAAGLEPLVPFPGGNDPWLCRCTRCGNTVAPRYSTVRRGTGCRYCARYGYWQGEGRAVLYLVGNSDFAAVKIGVTREGTRTTRLGKHERNGWQLLRTWTHPDPEVIFDIEQAILRDWRDAGIPEAVAPEQMPQGGSTETAPAHLVDVEELDATITRALRAPRQQVTA